MQPNRSATPWGFLAGAVTVGIVLSGVWLVIAVLLAVPGTGISSGDALEDSLCATTSRDVTDGYSRPDDNGVRTTTQQVVHCKPYREFAQPWAARLLGVGSAVPIVLAALGSLLALRRVVHRTWDHGPFHPVTLQQLDRLRWQVALGLGVGILLHWVLQGVTLLLLTDDTWPDLPFVPIGLTVLATVAVFELCRFGTSQRFEATGGDHPDDGAGRAP